MMSNPWKIPNNHNLSPIDTALHSKTLCIKTVQKKLCLYIKQS